MKYIVALLLGVLIGGSAVTLRQHQARVYADLTFYPVANQEGITLTRMREAGEPFQPFTFAGDPSVYCHEARTPPYITATIPNFRVMTNCRSAGVAYR